MVKKKVLFVGSFLKKATDGSVGGQMYACRSLVDSHLSYEIDWILLDTTGKSVPPPPVIERLFLAVFRIFKFIYLLTFRSPDSVLIFSANGPSVYEKGTMIIIAKLMGKKTIFAPRGGALINEFAESRGKRLFFNILANRSDYIICQGVFWKKYFQGMLGLQFEDKLVVISNWIDLKMYQLPPESISKHDPQVINVLFMGWMQVEKGVHDLFEALMRIKNLNKKINVYFLGDGNQREILQNRAITENKNKDLHFFFPGWVHGMEKLSYLQLADIFVLPSHAEGMPNSLMEAMTVGIASISTNVGAVPDLIEDQVNGLLFNSGDINALTCLLNQLMLSRELRESFATKAKEKIYRNHSIENAVFSFKRIL
jgi:glycosyltransferase involved in cell wall biosynthesis